MILCMGYYASEHTCVSTEELPVEETLHQLTVELQVGVFCIHVLPRDFHVKQLAVCEPGPLFWKAWYGLLSMVLTP